MSPGPLVSIIVHQWFVLFKMKVAVVLCFAASLAIATAMPPPGGFGGFIPTAAGAFIPSPAMIQSFIPSPAMIQSFIPTPEEIAALNALNTTPESGDVSTPDLRPTPPPTMPSAVANLLMKYRTAAAAFMPSAAGGWMYD